MKIRLRPRCLRCGKRTWHLSGFAGMTAREGWCGNCWPLMRNEGK